jgi:hypothetical protein
LMWEAGISPRLRKLQFNHRYKSLLTRHTG